MGGWACCLVQCPHHPDHSVPLGGRKHIESQSRKAPLHKPKSDKVKGVAPGHSNVAPRGGQICSGVRTHRGTLPDDGEAAAIQQEQRRTLGT
jgi:hypothetical protein